MIQTVHHEARTVRHRHKPAFCLLVFTIAWYDASWSQGAYQVPPLAMSRLVDAPSTPRVSVSPSRTHAVLLERKAVTDIKQLAQHEVKLAGLRIRPATFSPSRGYTYAGLSVASLTGAENIKLSLPEGRVFDPQWSPSGQRLGWVLEQDEGLVFWTLDLATMQTRAFPGIKINGVLGGQLYHWVRQGSAIVTRQATHAGQRWHGSAIPVGPSIQETDGEKAPVRTYQDLLRNADDARYFAYLARSQIVRLDLDSSQTTVLGQPDIYAEVQTSPDGRYILATRLLQPFSYLVPYYRFAQRTELWGADGVFLKTVSELPVGENLPKGFDSVIAGRRSLEWRADQPATLVWLESQDDGDMRKPMAVHDIGYQWTAPFAAKPVVLFRFAMRGTGFTWGNDQLAVAHEWRFSDRRYRATKFAPDDVDQPAIVFQERSYNDEYADPGSLVMTQGSLGTDVLLIRDDGQVYLNGRGASPRGYEPFFDLHDFKSGKTTRLWQSDAPYYERAWAVLDDQAQRLLISREAPEENPNFYLLNVASGSSRRLTSFPHPTPEFVGLHKELIHYQRADGLALSGTLYLPRDYRASDGPLPLLVWAYPQEYNDAAVAGQVRQSPYQFNRIGTSGPLPHLAQGIAVFDDPSMPIVASDGSLPNDQFRQQLIASASAAIDVLVARGIADRKRVAIAGHSYGAFMVANLLAHSDLFTAGIARSGAYNRSLTPFGFQGEERDFWAAQTVYASMSPFFHAEKINEPILLIHGEMDSNSGTYPLQSRRMFAALKGLGGNARLVMLPLESHGYQARESLLHMLWEQHRWIAQHLLSNPVSAP